MKWLGVLALAGCWRGGEAVPAGPIEPAEAGRAHGTETTVELCPDFGFKYLMQGAIVVNGQSAAPAFDTAQAEAEHAAEQAAGAARTNVLHAAELFMTCAEAYRAVPDTDPLRGTADYNAVVCYENAMYSYAMAGVLKTKGRPELERAADADPRVASEIWRMLSVLPKDCKVRR